MTDEITTTDNVFEAKVREILTRFHGMALTPAVTKELLSAISKALEAERLEERERCAKVADVQANAAKLHSPALMVARVIAAAIRSRETDNG